MSSLFSSSRSSTTTPLPQPRLLIRAGASRSSLSTVPVNTLSSTPILTDDFEGNVAVRIVDFLGPTGEEGQRRPEEGWTGRDGDVTWSISVRGRFLHEEGVEAGDLLWGNVWENPIRDYLPTGTSAILKLAHIRDPSITHDLYADKPWALSPWLSTCQFISIAPSPASSPLPEWKPTAVPENVLPLFTEGPEDNKAFVERTKAFKGNMKDRREFFANQESCRGVKVGRGDVVEVDFCHGHIDFSTLSVKLPMGFSLPLVKHWDGQPITFILKNKSNDQSSSPSASA